MSQLQIKQIANLQSSLNLKAPLASPALTGNPTAPTTSAADNSTTLATTAYVKSLAGAANPLMDASVAAVGTSYLYSRQDHQHPSDSSRAPLNSPNLTGSPTAPTPTVTDNSTALATTAFVRSLGYLTGNQTITLTGDATGSGTTSIAVTLSTVNASTGTFGSSSVVPVITTNNKGLITSVASAAITPASIGAAPLNSPALTGTPTAPTPTVTDNSTNIATTAYVVSKNYITAAALTTYAPLNSPALTGSPTAPTVTSTDSSTAIATTAFVANAVIAEDAKVLHTTGNESASGTKTFTTSVVIPTLTATDNSTFAASTAFVRSLASSTLPLMDASAAIGSSIYYARADHCHATDTSRAPLASPALTGSPTAPTPSTGDSSTLLATTAFIKNQGYATLASPTFTGTVQAPTVTSTDNSTNVATTAWVRSLGLSTLNSPNFTGTPTAPTPTAGDNSTDIATTAFVTNALSTALTAAMIYKGTIDVTTASPPASPATGWMYRNTGTGAPKSGWSFSTTVTVIDAGDFVTFNGTTYDRTANVEPSVSAGNGIVVTPTGDTSYQVAISASYTGGTSITTLGTITTGTWSGSTIGVGVGGTGLTSIASNSVLATGSTANTIVPVALASGTILGNNGSGPAALTAAQMRTLMNVRTATDSAAATSGSMTLLTLTNTPLTPSSVEVTFNGLVLQYTTDYTISGTTVTATSSLNTAYGGLTGSDGLGFSNSDNISAYYEY